MRAATVCVHLQLCQLPAHRVTWLHLSTPKFSDFFTEQWIVFASPHSCHAEQPISLMTHYLRWSELLFKSFDWTDRDVALRITRAVMLCRTYSPLWSSDAFTEFPAGVFVEVTVLSFALTANSYGCALWVCLCSLWPAWTIVAQATSSCAPLRLIALSITVVFRVI